MAMALHFAKPSLLMRSIVKSAKQLIAIIESSITKLIMLGAFIVDVCELIPFFNQILLI